MYGRANEADAYKFMWENSFRNGEQWKENFAWVTSKGVLVLPITSKSTSRNSDFSVLPTRTTGGEFQVQYNGGWINVLAAIHTHPGDPNMLSDVDLKATVDWGIPIFAIQSNTVWVGYGLLANPVYHGVITDTKYLLSGEASVYRDLLPLVPIKK